MKVQRVIDASGAVSYTVIDQTLLPVEPVGEYLRFLHLDGASPNTIRSYAAGLASWWRFLDLVGARWDDFAPLRFGEYTAWLRTGDLPGAARIGTPPQLVAPSTVQARTAAVLAFYRYQAAANGLSRPYDALYSPLARRGRRPYVRFLDGVARTGPAPDRPLFKVRTGPKGRTPILAPEQVQTILDGCNTQRADGTWTGSLSGLRNRLYFAVLAETGMRPGEALSLRHNDIRLGKGECPAIDLNPRQDHPHGMRQKSGRYRRVYVGDDLESLYAAYVWALVDAGADMMIKDFPASFVFVNGAAGTGPSFAPLRMETIYAAVRSLKRRYPQVLPSQWTPHWLRHTHATALLLSGCPTHVVMRRLGHLDVQTTTSVYGWVTEDAELRAVADWKQFAHGWKEHLNR